jgi:hypothetical protein
LRLTRSPRRNTANYRLTGGGSGLLLWNLAQIGDGASKTRTAATCGL